MQTRNKAKALEVVETSPVVAKETKPAKPEKKSNEKSSNALVDNLIDSIQKQNDEKTTQKLPASQKTLLPKISQKPSEQSVRGKPKSGRPWKSIKQK